MTAQLQHVSGDFFIMYANALNAHNAYFQTYGAAKFRVGVDGKVSDVGLGLEPQMGGDLVWFERVG
jgi:hypothetical protein